MYVHVIMGVLSGLFWLWFFFSRGAVKTVKGNVWRAFLGGVLAAVIALFLETVIDYFFPMVHDTGSKILVFFQMFCFVAPLEEYSKSLIMENGFLKKDKMNTAADGIAVGVACALGFGALENIFYFIRYPQTEVFMLRCTLSILGHASFSGVMGYYMYLASVEKNKAEIHILKGLFSAIVLHGFYNFLIASNTYFSFLIYVQTIAIMLFLESQMVRSSTQKVSVLKFILIPVIVICIAVFLVRSRVETFYRDKNIVEIHELDKLYEDMSPEKVEKILGHPTDVSEFFGRDEMFYRYYAKNLYNDYRVVILRFVKRKLKIKEIH